MLLSRPEQWLAEYVKSISVAYGPTLDPFSVRLLKTTMTVGDVDMLANPGGFPTSEFSLSTLGSKG